MCGCTNENREFIHSESIGLSRFDSTWLELNRLHSTRFDYVEFIQFHTTQLDSFTHCKSVYITFKVITIAMLEWDWLFKNLQKKKKEKRSNCNQINKRENEKRLKYTQIVGYSQESTIIHSITKDKENIQFKMK